MRIAILGGGPSGMFMLKRLIESGQTDLKISIFERKPQLGAGMPYSAEGACEEHVTNVSDNEIPTLVTSVREWLADAPAALLAQYNISPENFNEFKVLPRLFFGVYLQAQFDLMVKQARNSGLEVTLHLSTEVADIIDNPGKHDTTVILADGNRYHFDAVVICSGHNWPKQHEGKNAGYFDSPYPPRKLKGIKNHPVAVRGSSLTAIDAIRTLARENGSFITDDAGNMHYELREDCADFRIDMHSRSGLLPAVRFHLEDSHLHHNGLLSADEISAHITQNGGFLSLDYIFEKDFKDTFREKDPEFHRKIEAMSIEEFVAAMMELRETLEPFQLLKAEYQQAEKSIHRQQSIHWKEMLAVLSFALNYPAKYLSAEDMIRLKATLMPLISVVIAFVPQSSCKELLALHQANVLNLIAVGDDSEVTPQAAGGISYSYTDADGNDVSMQYNTFVDSIGQPALAYQDVPFPGLRSEGTISPARLRFKSAAEGQKAMDSGKEVTIGENGDYYLMVSGIGINDNFQVLDKYGAYNPRVYIMAVPYIGGYNPDYSGLDFCEAASLKIREGMERENVIALGS